jgi:hypothetical protein
MKVAATRGKTEHLDQRLSLFGTDIRPARVRSSPERNQTTGDTRKLHIRKVGRNGRASACVIAPTELAWKQGGMIDREMADGRRSGAA